MPAIDRIAAGSAKGGAALPPERATLARLAVMLLSLGAPLAAMPATAAQAADAGVPTTDTGPRTGGARLGTRGEPVPDIDAIIEGLDRRAPVTALAFSPDGALLASASEDHQVRVWDLATRRLLRRLRGHSSVVHAVAFSPDGGTIASASSDRTVRLWDARSGRPLHTLQGHVYHVYALAFDPRGRFLATASWDRTIQLWDPRGGALLGKLRGHAAAVRSVDFSPDGKLLASASDDRTIRLWSAAGGTELKVLAGHAGPVTAVRFRPDGGWLFSGATDRSVRSWRLPDGAVARTLVDCGAPVQSLAVSPNGQVLAGACGAAGAFLWDAQTSAQLRRLGGDGAETHAVAFSPDGRLVATGTEDGSIVVRDVAAGRAVASLSADVAHLEAVASSPDGRMLATAARDGRVLLWQEEGDHLMLSRVLVDEPGSLRALAFSPDGTSLAAGAENGRVAVWALGADGPARRLAAHDGPVNAVAFTADGRTLASAGDDATLRLWNLGKDGEAKALKGHGGPVRALGVSPDGALLASASDDQTARLWSAATGRSAGVLRSHRAPVTSVVFTPEGKHLITGAQDRTIDVWLVPRGRLLRSLRKELPSGVVALAVARGGRIAAASSDGTLSLWELAGPRPLAQSTAPAGAPSALAVTPDGAILASASRDGVLRLWDGRTLERRWSLAGSDRQRWFACKDGGTCWRQEDGTLLGRVTGAGDIVPVSPADQAHRTALAAAVDWDKLGGAVELREGKTVQIPVRIKNRGAHPAYWVNVAQSVKRSAASRASLVLIPPPTIPVLAPATSADVVCEVSALGEYENPQPHREPLRLSITSASAEARSLTIPVEVEPPHLEMRRLTLDRGRSRALVASLTQVSMAGIEPVSLLATLTVAGRGQPAIAPITLEQALDGQDLALSFPLPEGVRLDRRTLATLTVRKSTHPAHVWTFADSPVHIPSPTWAWVLLLVGLLGLVLAGWQARVHVRARSLARTAKRIARLAMTVVHGLAKAVRALIFLPSTLRALRARLRRRGIAVTFFRLEPETQCSHLARQLGAAWRPLAADRQPVFELELGPEVPLDVERCLLALPRDAAALTAALHHLDAAGDGQDGHDSQGEIALVLADDLAPASAEHLRARRPLVVCGKAAMNRILRAPRPALAFAQVVSEQVDRTRVSLYRSAAAGGPRQPFYGRKAELRRLAADPPRSHLLIGPQGSGKTSLLDQVYRRLATHPGITCYYLSLADGSLTTALADALGLPGEPSLDILLEELARSASEKRTVVLCDDADAWATSDAEQGGAELEALARLDREHRCCFVLAGFLGLLHATRPLPGRKQLGGVVRLEALDYEACVELATEPMAALNLRYASAGLVERLVRQSGGMPSLLSTICDQVVDLLAPDQHTIDRTAVDRALKSEAVARAITAWRPRFGLPEPRFAMVDQTVMLSAVFKPRFTLAELESTLAGLGVTATTAEIRHSANRLVAACVFEHWLGHFHFRVPLFQTVMQEAALARMIAQS